jgi:hypothetical protein
MKTLEKPRERAAMLPGSGGEEKWGQAQFSLDAVVPDADLGRHGFVGGRLGGSRNAPMVMAAIAMANNCPGLVFIELSSGWREAHAAPRRYNAGRQPP